MPIRRGPELPYSIVAGVTPWGRRWLVGSAKSHAATFMPQPPQLFSTFLEVLSQYPAFAVVVVNAPIGSLDDPEGPVRACDREARALLGRRASAVHYAPSRSVLGDSGSGPYAHVDAVTATMLARYREVAAEMSPFRQRVVYEGHPELSFFQLNGDVALRWSKRREEGREVRRLLLEERIPGVDVIIDADLEGVPLKHLLDVAALTWTARRVLGRAAKRIPRDAQWDSEGLRMEFVY